MMWVFVVTVTVVNIFFAVGVVCMPISDKGPHISHGWGQVVRLRHLYAVRPGLHLLIDGDGEIHGSVDQTLYSLLEIRPVNPGCIVIQGVATARFLCIESNGRLYSSHTYIREDCTFREQILPDGHNIYISDTHGALLSLGNHRQRLQGFDQGAPALAQFLPRISTLDPMSSSRQGNYQICQGLSMGPCLHVVKAGTECWSCKTASGKVDASTSKYCRLESVTRTEWDAASYYLHKDI